MRRTAIYASLKPASEMSQVLLPEQVADLLQITVEAVHDLRLKGLLKCIRIGHRTIRFTEKQVADYLAKISQ